MSRKKQPLDAGLRSKAARERMMQARTALVLDEPFFGLLSARLKLVEDPSCDTMWTDSVSLGYNPDYALEISPMECKGVVCHEVLHVSNGHCWRRGSRDPEDWNIAADYAINPIVIAAGYLLPEGALLKPEFNGKHAELIYDRIHQPQSGGAQGPSKKSDTANQQEGEGGSTGQSSSDPQANNAKEPQEGDAGDGSEDETGQAGQGQASDTDPNGEGNGQSTDAPASEKPKHRAAGEVRDVPEGYDAKELEQEWKIAVLQAATAAEAYGKLPGCVKELIEDLKKPVINWKEALWQFVQQSHLSPDYTWRRPSRRYMSLNLYMPSLQGEQMPPLVVAIDDSASVSSELLKQFFAELGAITENTKPEVTYLLTADTRVTDVQEILPGDDVVFEAKGRGGTDFRPVFKWVEEQGIDPCCLIYLTDMDGPAPAQEPDYPVLWITPPRSPKAPWGTQIELPL